MFSQSSKYTIFFTVPLLLYIWYTFYMHLSLATYMSWIDLVDFFIHEFWHIFFGVFWNEFLSVAWWTLLQVIIPFLLLFMFLKQRDYFAVALSYAWLWTNFFYISTYSWDAVKMNLPLVWTWSWEVIHDWFYMFNKLWIIQHTDLISGFFYFIAIVLFVLSFFYSSILIFNRFKERKI